MEIRVLIVDDEELAREGVRGLLESLPNVKIAGECNNGLDAVAAIEREKPDLVFLDVQMPGLDGFGVIEKIGAERMPPVIFVTAYDKYALRAFQIHALDYLLKPVDDDRFNEAFRRAAAQFANAGDKLINRRFAALLEDLKSRQQDLEDNLKADPNYLERIVVKTAGRIFFVEVEEVDYFKAADNYVELHVGTKTHLVREAITRLENRLNARQFIRISRSIIVNIKHIKELHPLFNGEFAVILKNGTELTSSRRFRKNFDILLNS